MPEKLPHIKAGVIQRGKKLLDLAAETGIEYNMLSQYIGGFKTPPTDFEQRVKSVFRRWDEKASAI